MDLADYVCGAFPDVCTGLHYVQVVLVTIGVIGGLSLTLFLIVGMWRGGFQEYSKCPKCKNRVLHEEAYDDAVPSPGPHGIGMYRRFYLVCSPGCGEKIETEAPELLCRKKFT